MRRIGVPIALLIVAMAGLFALSFGSSTVSAADDPEAALQALIDAANESIPSGDGAALANAFTEDGVFANRDDGFAIVGRVALTGAFSDEPDPSFHATLLTSEVDGSTITGSAEIADQDSVDAGVGSHIELFTLTAEGGLVSSFILTYDHDDPDTVTYLEFLASQHDDGEDDGEDGPPPGAVDIELTGDQPGTATIAEDPSAPGVVFVQVAVEPGEEGVVQPAHIHTGTCDEPGGIVYPLAYPVDGFSFTILSTSQADLLGHDYILNVHLSEEEPGTYVACAVLKSEGGVGLPGTGTNGSTSTDLSWLVALLALVGVGSVVGAGAAARRR